MENFTDLPIDRYVTIVEGSGLKWVTLCGFWRRMPPI